MDLYYRREIEVYRFDDENNEIPTVKILNN